MILENKNVFISGVGKGIGKSMCDIALRNGAFVYGVTRSKEDAKKFKKNKNLKLYCGDISNLNLIKKIFLDSKKNKKLITGVINNAGIRFRKPFEKITQNDLDNVFKNNFFSIFKIIQIYSKYLGKKNKHDCSIVNIGSIVGRLGFAELAAYASSKSALDALTKSLSIELSNKKIRINTISPGFIKTSYFKKFKKKKKLYNWTISRIPQKNWGNPEDIAEFAIFLLSDKSKYFNGENVAIDGGWVNS